MLLFNDAAARALGVIHFTHRLMLLAAHATPVGRFTILITAFIKASFRIAHDTPPVCIISAMGRLSTTAPHAGHCLTINTNRRFTTDIAGIFSHRDDDWHHNYTYYV